MGIFKTVILTLVAGYLISAAAYAEPEKKAPENSEWAEKMKARHEELFKDLGLNEEQKKALGENRKKHRDNAQGLRQAMRDKMTQMRQELQKEQLDMEKVGQIQSELKAVQAKMMDQRLEGILEVRKILTPDQFKKFSEKMEERKKHFWHHDGKEHSEHRAGPEHPEHHPQPSEPPDQPEDREDQE